MTFLLIVLAIHIALDRLAPEKTKVKESDPLNTTVHPAEFNLR